MHPFSWSPYIFIISGIISFLLGIPSIKEKTIGRLQKIDVVPTLNIDPKKTVIIRATGPQFNLIFLGTVLIIFGIVLLFYK